MAGLIPPVVSITISIDPETRAVLNALIAALAGDDMPALLERAKQLDASNKSLQSIVDAHQPATK